MDVTEKEKTEKALRFVGRLAARLCHEIPMESEGLSQSLLSSYLGSCIAQLPPGPLKETLESNVGRFTRALLSRTNSLLRTIELAGSAASNVPMQTEEEEDEEAAGIHLDSDLETTYDAVMRFASSELDVNLEKREAEEKLVLIKKLFCTRNIRSHALWKAMTACTWISSGGSKKGLAAIVSDSVTSADPVSFNTISDDLQCAKSVLEALKLHSSGSHSQHGEPFGAFLLLVAFLLTSVIKSQSQNLLGSSKRDSKLEAKCGKKLQVILANLASTIAVRNRLSTTSAVGEPSVHSFSRRSEKVESTGNAHSPAVEADIAILGTCVQMLAAGYVNGFYDLASVDWSNKELLRIRERASELIADVAGGSDSSILLGRLLDKEDLLPCLAAAQAALLRAIISESILLHTSPHPHSDSRVRIAGGTATSARTYLVKIQVARQLIKTLKGAGHRDHSCKMESAASNLVPPHGMATWLTVLLDARRLSLDSIPQNVVQNPGSLLTGWLLKSAEDSTLSALLSNTVDSADASGLREEASSAGVQETGSLFFVDKRPVGVAMAGSGDEGEGEGGAARRAFEVAALSMMDAEDDMDYFLQEGSSGSEDEESELGDENVESVSDWFHEVRMAGDESMAGRKEKQQGGGDSSRKRKLKV